MRSTFARRLSTAVSTRLTYPARPPLGYQNGRTVTQTHWDKIGDIFPQEPWTGSTAKLDDQEVVKEITVRDGRGASKPLTLERSGFELRSWPTKVTEFLDDEIVKTQYYKDTEALVKAATGATDAIVFQHMRRDGALHNKESAADQTLNQTTAPAHGAVQRVHADYTSDNGPMKLRELVDAGVVPAESVADADKRGWSIVNVWRSIDVANPVQSLPLAVLDASTVKTDDTFTYALVMEEGREQPLVGFNNGVSYSDAHEWYYFSKMTHDEALLFYTYDDSFASSNPRFVFHTAIDTGAGPDALPRRSIECRCLVLF